MPGWKCSGEKMVRGEEDAVENEPGRRRPSNGGHGTIKFLEWNVYYKNKDHRGMAEVISAGSPDIFGLCEFEADMGTLASELNSRTSGKNYRAQSGRHGRTGYGTDIWFDSNKYIEIEAGKKVVDCPPHTRGGVRAANYVVLREKSTDRHLITGGVHLSSCWINGGSSSACKNNAQKCEARKFYQVIEPIRSKYPDAPLVWMGDMNEGPGMGVVADFSAGNIGFPVDDVARASSRTHKNGGKIDFIFAETGKFTRLDGGNVPGQGGSGSDLKGSDHYPVFATLKL